MTKKYVHHKVGDKTHKSDRLGLVGESFYRCTHPQCEINKEWDEHIKGKPLFGKIIETMSEVGRKAKEVSGNGESES